MSYKGIIGLKNKNLMEERGGSVFRADFTKKNSLFFVLEKLFLIFPHTLQPPENHQTGTSFYALFFSHL